MQKSQCQMHGEKHLADNVKMWRLSEIQWLQPPFFLTLHGGKTRDTPHVFRVSHPTVVVWFMGSPGCLLFGAFVAAFPFSAALGGPIKRRILWWLTTTKKSLHRVENYHHRLPNLKKWWWWFSSYIYIYHISLGWYIEKSIGCKVVTPILPKESFRTFPPLDLPWILLPNNFQRP